MSAGVPGLERAVATVKALRGEGGCPWDKAQTHETLRKYLLEETYEVLEAVDRLAAKPGPESMAHFREELGDLLLQVLLHAEIARQGGHFSIDEVAGELSEKLVRRHPHVFGGAGLGSPEEVRSAWEEIKKAENPGRKGALEGVPAALPALQKALKVIERVSRVGFQWPDLRGPLEKVREELGELEAELAAAGGEQGLRRETAAELPAEARKKLEAELGDLLFTVANVAYFLDLNPEDALRSMLGRFEARFRRVEEGASRSGRPMEELSLEEMDRFWNEAKREER